MRHAADLRVATGIRRERRAHAAGSASVTTPGEHPVDVPADAPSAAALCGCDADTWAWLLPEVRAALGALGDDREDVRRLREAPTGRLAGGALREALCTLIAEDAQLWSALRARLVACDTRPAELVTLWAAPSPTGKPARRRARAGGPGRVTAGTAPAPAPQAAGGRAPTTDSSAARAARLSDQVRALREERDGLRRQLDGALARVRRLEDEVTSLRDARTQAEHQLAQLQSRLDDAASARTRAVERERRRHDSQIERLHTDITSLRRTVEEHRAEQRRREQRAAAAAESASAPSDEDAVGLIPGRPSRLPRGVAPGTRDAASLLLHPGRLVLVDGYNVTLTHRDGLDLEAQRRWLLQLLGNLAASRRIRPVVVFDGARSGSGRSVGPGRGVEVRFTPEGITADDELHLAVEATDEPVLVVTDDRELTERVRAAGADVLATAPFVWVSR